MRSRRIYSRELSKTKILKIHSLRDLRGRKKPVDLGNKALSQIRLFQWNYRVPDSIFLDYSFFEYYLNQRALPDRLSTSLVISDLAKELSIRSSSSVEDSAEESYAGFFKTILHVPKEPRAIRQALIDCYCSVPGGALDHARDIKMGIIVQSMIPPGISGILFTDSPLNPANNNYRIEYCLGRGDKLTASQLTGYALTLDKATGKIVQQEGNVLFSEKSLLRLWRIATDLEKKFRFPQDVEFVISQNTEEIYLLQSRPITAFSYTPEYVIQKENERIRASFAATYAHYQELPILSSSNIVELFPNAAPLSFSIFQYIFAGTANKIGAINAGRRFLNYTPITKQAQSGLFLTIGNQARTNLLIDALTFCLSTIPASIYAKSVVPTYLQLMRTQEEKANYPEGEVYLQAPDLEECRQYFGERGPAYFKHFNEFLSNLRIRKIPSYMRTIERRLQENDEYYREEFGWLSKSIRRLALTGLKQKLQEYMDYLRKNVCVQYVVIARIAFLSTYLIKKELRRPCYYDLLDSSSQENHLARDAQRDDTIDRIVDCLLAYEYCPDLFKIPDQSEFIERVNQGEMTLNEFLEIFGHIGPLDLMQPRLIETDQRLLESLFQTPPVKPAKADRELLTSISFYDRCQTLNPQEFDTFKMWLRNAKSFMLLRERFKYEFLKVLYLIKHIILELQTRAELNDLVHYLNYEELIALDRATRSQSRLIAMQRKAYHEACSLLKLKSVIKSPDEENFNGMSVSPRGNDQSYKVMGGKTIHHGQAEGYCLIARTTQEYYKKLIAFRESGIRDIIGFFKGLELSYCRLDELSGIVTENGGYLAHAATIAREHNLPYISNVQIDYFQDDYYVILDTANHQVIYRES